MRDIEASGTLAFHVMGDVGGIKSPEPQRIVATHLQTDVENSRGTGAPVPAFLYLLGDVVYYFGAASDYESQFYDPYIHYPQPIVGVPGNHDGNVDPHAPQPSLAAFVENFCSATPHLTPEAGQTTREAMTQPNVYWTFDVPFATIVGLYTNVPEGGQFDLRQTEWLHAELAAAPKDKALLLTMHHPMFSGDEFHAGSQYLVEVVDSAVRAAGRSPDLVLGGHVHNYQRYTRTTDSQQVPYIVAGAGGYWHLHAMAHHNGGPIRTPLKLDDQLTLESFNQHRHGFLRVDVGKTSLRGTYFVVPWPHQSWSVPSEVFDSFVLDLETHRVTER